MILIAHVKKYIYFYILLVIGPYVCYKNEIIHIFQKIFLAIFFFQLHMDKIDLFSV
jgi:hypothetical protein